MLGAPIAYSRIYFHKDSPMKPRERRQAFWGYVAVAVFWTAVYTAVAWFGLWREFALAWVAPWLIAGFIQTVRKFTEHLGMASYDPMLGTRTVIGRNWLTRLTTWLNFDIFVHGPHHRHPKMAHDQLAGVVAEYAEEHAGPDVRPGAAHPVFPTYLAAVRHMLPSLVFNPGCGANAGGGAAAARKPR